MFLKFKVDIIQIPQKYRQQIGWRWRRVSQKPRVYFHSICIRSIHMRREKAFQFRFYLNRCLLSHRRRRRYVRASPDKINDLCYQRCREGALLFSLIFCLFYFQCIAILTLKNFRMLLKFQCPSLPSRTIWFAVFIANENVFVYMIFKMLFALVFIIHLQLCRYQHSFLFS